MTITFTALVCLGLSVGLRIPVQAGTLPKPTLWAEPGSVIPWGRPVTIWCQATLEVKGFHLRKYGLSKPWDKQNPLEPGNKAKFSITYMTDQYAGRYYCYYHSPSGWSDPSDPLDILVAGWISDKPSLSVQPGNTVTSGEKVTLLCQSQTWSDTLLLSKEGAVDPPLRLHSKYRAQQYQAEFSMSPVTSAHGGTYRCYSSLSTSPYLLSHPSEPLELLVSGPSWDPSPPPTGPISIPGSSEDLFLSPADSDPHWGLPWYLYVLIGVSLALILLLSLLFLFLRHRHQGKGRTSGCTDPEPKNRGLQISSIPAVDAQEEPVYAAVKDPQPGESVELDAQNRHDEDPQSGMYAQVNHPRSRLRQEMGTSPSSLSGGLLNMKGRQAEKAAASDAPQDVTYTQLNHVALR